MALRVATIVNSQTLMDNKQSTPCSAWFFVQSVQVGVQNKTYSQRIKYQKGHIKQVALAKGK